MSGSPKYSRASLSAARERELQRRRAEEAAREAQRRKEQAARMRAERLARAQSEGRRKATDVGGRLAAFRQTAAAARAAAELDRLETQLQSHLREVNDASDEGQVLRKQREITQLGDSLRREIARAEAEHLAAGLAKEEAALAVAESVFAAQDAHASLKFDAAGYADVQSLFAQASDAIRRKALSDAAQWVEKAKARLARHQADVAGSFEQWSTQRAAAQSAVAAASDALAGLSADPVVARWQAKELAALRARLDRANELIEAEQFAAAAAQSEATVEESTGLVSATQQIQLKEDRRQYIVRGIQQVMEQLGFIIEPGSPSLEHANYPTSAMILQSRRVSGESIAVSVPHDGEVWYSVDGFPMRADRRQDGGEARSCDEAEAQIATLHAQLGEMFGIHMSELQWEGKDPKRIRKKAERLPDAVARGSTQHRQRPSN